MTRHYVFKESGIRGFKYCPYCGGEIMQVYLGDYMGFVQCEDCEICEEKLDFYILEEMIDRRPEWIFDVIRRPYERELNRLREYAREIIAEGDNE